MRDERKQTVKKAVLYAISAVVIGALLIFGWALFVVSHWYGQTFDLEFKELLYTMMSPLKGTGEDTVSEILGSCLPPVICFACVYIVIAVSFYFRRDLWKRMRKIGVIATALVLVGSLVFSAIEFRMPAYIIAQLDKTTIYEDYYVDPNDVVISSDGKTKNLIYIYVESLETTYASYELGGNQPHNYMPNLTELAQENVSFSDKAEGQLGGFHNPTGTGWTMAALLSSTSGIPFSFPVGELGGNDMGKREKFASGLTTLGDILNARGYKQEFLCGSDAAFAGRDLYFTQHGNYEIFDYYAARDNGYIAPDYSVFWGYEDAILYQIAKDELLDLASGSQPFNFTMLTVDLHHTGGYFCSECETVYPNETANIVCCADRQLGEFIDWCKQQSFYEDSVIIITGDHPRMDTILVEGVEDSERMVYNCFINAAVTPKGAVFERSFTILDIFPTTLAAMGFTIEGNRLGLGVNLFSGEATLAEQMGYSTLEDEVKKYSDYYIQKFS
ncbi:MAG: LTA synthase family protein [Clostridia bacterium]|nr:LTA synthase family protein [Clostridia bacterium]